MALLGGAREAMRRLDGLAVAVYLLNDTQPGLDVAMISGSPPSIFTMPSRMDLESPLAPARAARTGKTTVLMDPHPSLVGQQHLLPYPYTALAAPVIGADRTFGALIILRLEDRGAYLGPDHVMLQEISDELGTSLAALAAGGIVIRAAPTPIVVPILDRTTSTPGWGIPRIPSSAGTSLMYPLRQLADLLNRATTMEHVVEAGQRCVMAPLGAEALVLAGAADGRLWVLGHSGSSSLMVQTLHGSWLESELPAAQAVTSRRALFLSDRRAGESTGSKEWAETYLPLVDTSQVIAPPPNARGSDIVGVCCLAFPQRRDFPPEERAVLGMMAGLLGSTVERIQLGIKQYQAAEELQRHLLPSALPDLPRLSTTTRYRPALDVATVGGDWYDVLNVSDERKVLVVGDVEGHAIESAAVMGQVRTATAAYVMEGHRPATVLDRAGRLLTALDTDLTVTCCVVSLDIDDGTAEVALAGHPQPVVQRPDGTIRFLDAPRNLPLGVTTRHAYQGREHTLEPGSVLMLYTDGLVDWSATDWEAEAARLLRSEIGDSDLEEVADGIIGIVSNPERRRDDAVLLLAHFQGAEAGNLPRVGTIHIQHRDLHGVKAARIFVDGQLRAWHLTDITDDLQLITSEVVTNALIHAATSVDVRLRAFSDYVRLEVRDFDSNPPIPSPLATEEESANAEHGRGLAIVEALASRWNSSPNGRGKTITVDLPIPQTD
ncbi:SpoIIE family protein phosphatase [Streptomyces sp. WAC 01325]|uniref:SpoIIE family protein phosphatase n=1 Tax=Streptomyces sp. WAC 01325 TaxID=2203202 RepID=UPI0021B0439C|nr:SpoIIE family protein phosphatase [Streptomyces sp. WAC 01325]